ncbi:MAG: hypothetical protein ABIJ92_01900 [Candidatus Aenigmatarchaeota archaeon]
MSKFRYITKRVLKDKDGLDKGRIVVIVRTGSDMAEVDYTCPECEKAEHIEVPWVRPFKTRCTGCNCLMKITKLKDDIKREKKAEAKREAKKAQKAKDAQEVTPEA